MITIIDTGICNMRSIHFKLLSNGINCKISDDPTSIKDSKKLILPGVGHFRKGMTNLKEKGIANALNEMVLDKNIPIFGICLGMQMMTKFSEEGNTEGLGWIDAQTRKFDFSDSKSNLSIPHVGWNTITQSKDSENLDFNSGDFFYFTHSYYVDCSNQEDILTTTDYGINFVSAFEKGNIIGTQFHPEKSHYSGFKMLLDFCNKDFV